MSAGLSLRSMRCKCHCWVCKLFDAIERGAEGEEDSDANREERKRGEIDDFIVISEVDILGRVAALFAHCSLADIRGYILINP